MSHKLIRFLARKEKSKPIEEKTSVADKLKRQERLTDDEFWYLYELFRQAGPEVKFSNPENWVNQGQK